MHVIVHLWATDYREAMLPIFSCGSNRLHAVGNGGITSMKMSPY